MSVDLNEAVSDAVRLVGNDVLLRQASVKFERIPGLLPVFGDRIQLCQVALNLIVNGLDATAERPPSERWVLVRTGQSDSGGVEFTVEDSGKGITEGDMGRVFEPFFSTKPEGLGMGLSISRSIVQAHGGRIWAEKSAGRGAIFQLETDCVSTWGSGPPRPLVHSVAQPDNLSKRRRFRKGPRLFAGSKAVWNVQ